MCFVFFSFMLIRCVLYCLSLICLHATVVVTSVVWCFPFFLSSPILSSFYIFFFLFRILPSIRTVHRLVGLRLRAQYVIVVVPLVGVIGVYVMYIVFRVLSSLMRVRSYIVVASPDFIVRCVFVSMCTLNLIIRCSISFCYICAHW